MAAAADSRLGLTGAPVSATHGVRQLALRGKPISAGQVVAAHSLLPSWRLLARSKAVS